MSIFWDNFLFPLIQERLLLFNSESMCPCKVMVSSALLTSEFDGICLSCRSIQNGTILSVCSSKSKQNSTDLPCSRK